MNLRGQRGFTLLEVTVVLAVIGGLVAMLSPVVFRYIDDANRTRAQADVGSFASAINKLYKDTGRWPIKATGTSNAAFDSLADPSILTSGGDCDPGDTDLASCDASEPTTGTGWDYSKRGDWLGRHLVTNAASYSTTGNRAWKGPYINEIPSVDPWGRSYLVNVANADPTVAEASQKWVIALSAGPDGVVNTSASTALNSNAVASGDDIIARVR